MYIFDASLKWTKVPDKQDGQRYPTGITLANGPNLSFVG